MTWQNLQFVMPLNRLQIINGHNINSVDERIIIIIIII